MFDNLRDLSDQQSDPAYDPNYVAESLPAPRVLGMTAGQRFILSLLLLGAVVMLGILCLVITQRVWL